MENFIFFVATPVQNYIHTHQEIEEQLRWYGHVKRTEDGKTVEQVAEWKPQGKRKRGRQINTWKVGIRESMKRRELKDEECMDRDLWRRKIMSLG
jgi:hypothetical protein